MKNITSKNYLNIVRVHFMPIVVWVSTIIVVVTLFSHRSRRYEILGVAQAPVHQIAATCNGRLVNLPVALFDEVKEGDVLAVLSTVADNDNSQELIAAKSAVIMAEIDELRAEWEAAKERLIDGAAGMETTAMMDIRRLDVDIEDKQFDVMQLAAQLAADGLKLDNIELDIKIFTMQAEMDANDVNLYRLKRLRGEYTAVAGLTKENEKLLQQAKLDLATAAERRKSFDKQLGHDPEMSAARTHLDKAVEVQNRRMAELKVELAALKPVTLKAPFAGVVSVVDRTAGEAVMAGEPILTIAKKTADSIVAYATEQQASGVREKMEVELVDRNHTPNLLVASEVVYVGPTIEQLPPRLWRNPNVPQWGRPIMIKMPAQLKSKLVPGAMVGIKGI